MRKIFQKNHQVPFLPSISRSISKRPSVANSNQNIKENVNVQSGLVQKFKMEPSHHCLVKRKSLKTPSSPSTPIQNIISKKLNTKDKVESDAPTQPRGNRPWVAQQLDLNNLATKTSRIVDKQIRDNSKKILRRKSCHYKASSTDQSLSNELRHDKTAKIPRNLGCRAFSLPRDKLNSCKIAMKKGPFPIDQKKYQRQKIADFFQEECLSTINDKQSDGQGLFMSFDSYLQIDF